MGGAWGAQYKQAKVHLGFPKAHKGLIIGGMSVWCQFKGAKRVKSGVCGYRGFVNKEHKGLWFVER